MPPKRIQGEKCMASLLRYESPLDRVFESFFAPVNGVRGGTIELDVVETPEAYVVKAEVPGVAKDKIEVKVEDRDVTIGVEYAEEIEATGNVISRQPLHRKASRASPR